MADAPKLFPCPNWIWGNVYYYRREADLEIAVIPLLLGRARINLAFYGDVGPFAGW